MPLPPVVIASIVSAVIETVSPSSVQTLSYDQYVKNRRLPPEAKLGYMDSPPGNGAIVIDGQSLPLAPVAQFRNGRNLIVMPMSIQQASNVVYVNDSFGNVRRVWLISQEEADSLKKD
jgi:hypothetical protein